MRPEICLESSIRFDICVGCRRIEICLACGIKFETCLVRGTRFVTCLVDGR